MPVILLPAHYTFGEIINPDICSLTFLSLLNSSNKQGDIYLGGLIQQSTSYDEMWYADSVPATINCHIPSLRFLRHFLAFDFAVKEIDNDLDLLPNVTLGYEIYDACTIKRIPTEATLRFLSQGTNLLYPNYNCRKDVIPVAVIGHLSSSISLVTASILKLYQCPQISYGATDSIFNDRNRFPFFYRTIPTSEDQNSAIVKLMNHFGWSLVGILTLADESNERSSNELRNQIIDNGNCVDFVIKLPLLNDVHKYEDIVQMLIRSSVNVIIAYVPAENLIFLIIAHQGFKVISKKVLILTDSTYIERKTPTPELYLSALHGSLMLIPSKDNIPGLKEFLYSATPSLYPNSILMKHIWEVYFNCTEPTTEDRCYSDDYLKLLPDYDYDVNNFRLTYRVYAAVYAVAHALHNMLSVQPTLNLNTIHPFQLIQHLRRVHFKTSSGTEIFFNKKGNTPTYLTLLNILVYRKTAVRYKEVGEFDTSSSIEQPLLLKENEIIWGPSFKETPTSACSSTCFPGFRKFTEVGAPACCFSCVPCLDGTISTRRNMYSCIECPEDEWSDMLRVKCVKKTIDFLSYEEDLGRILQAVSVSFCLMTNAVLIIFIKNKDTPIVKANNKHLSYIILISLMMCFLCPLLFIGQPTNVTCILRQVTFSIIFTVVVSSILAKTIVVFMAFRFIKPNLRFQTFLASKSSAVIVSVCSSIEIGVSTLSLINYPPFPQQDIRSVPGIIVLQCNEGSNFVFFVTHGYILFLALLCFVLAFLVRKLPDRFNEAHYITFSMLIFCSVWITFIPTYLSTKGKYMVAVEVFAILASGAGILCCIFFPKCYITLTKPDLNHKLRLSGSNLEK